MDGLNGVVRGVRIAHLIGSDGPGGAERVVARLAAALQADGATNVVFLPPDGEGWLARQLEGSGVLIDYVVREGRVSARCVRSLGTAFRRHRIAIAHSHEFSMAVYGALASRCARIPHVITMHGGRYYADRLRRRLALRTAIAASNRTVAVSASVARALSRDLRLSASRIMTIPNGVHYERPDRVTLRHELQLGSEDRLLVAVGNLYPVKGHQHLIDALGLLIGRYPTLHVAIGGRGELADALTARAEAQGLANHVHMLGLRSDVAAVLAAAEAFVQPSLSEGLPLALLEAMFGGCAIVASDVGDVATALDHGDAGVLVPPGDVPALAAALDGLLCDPHRARGLGERAALRAAAEYDESRMVRRYASLYAEVLHGSCAASPVLRTAARS